MVLFNIIPYLSEEDLEALLPKTPATLTCAATFLAGCAMAMWFPLLVSKIATFFFRF